MSNELFIVCLSHDPEIRSDMVAWSASPAALAGVRRWIALRDLIANAQVAGLGIPAEVTHAAGAFLAQHPHCRLGLIDESGTRHPVTEEGDEPATVAGPYRPTVGAPPVDEWRLVPTGPVERGGEMQRQWLMGWPAGWVTTGPVERGGEMQRPEEAK